jgi:hypothetical protein
VNDVVRRVNWFGLAAGIITLIVVFVSMYFPWWQLTIGEDLVKVNASPLFTEFGLFGTQFTIPILWALNLSFTLIFVFSGVLMLVYSFIPTKPYARELLGFSYKKPLYAVIFFLFGLVALVAIAGVLGLGIPLLGLTDISLPASLTMGATVSASVLTSFLLPFWLAIVATVLCIVARVYHNIIIKKVYQQTQPINPSQDTITIHP